MKNFKKSSFCEKGKCCVEVAMDKNTVYIRNTRNPEAIIHYTLQEWEAFLNGVKNSEFDVK